MNIFGLPRTEEEAVDFLQTKGVLPAERLCQKGHHMKLYFGSRIFWKCSKSTCRNKITIRAGTWLMDSRLSFVTTLRFLYSWAKELTSIKWCEEELGMHRSTAMEWNSYMREVVTEQLIRRQPIKKKIGGEGLAVEIDESVISKCKNNTADRLLPRQWIFGGICRKTRQCFLLKIPDRAAATLMAAIRENVEDGSIIYADSWQRGYKTEDLEEAGFEDFKIKHRYNFVDPGAIAVLSTVEPVWGSAKWRNKSEKGTARQLLNSNLAEFMWRQQQVANTGAEVFESLMEAIKEFPQPTEEQL